MDVPANKRVARLNWNLRLCLVRFMLGDVPITVDFPFRGNAAGMRVRLNWISYRKCMDHLNSSLLNHRFGYSPFN